MCQKQAFQQEHGMTRRVLSETKPPTYEKTINRQVEEGMRVWTVDTLNPMEESILSMTVWVAATGDLNVPEAGIPTSDLMQYNAELLTPLYDCEEVTIRENDDSFPLPACSESSVHWIIQNRRACAWLIYSC